MIWLYLVLLRIAYLLFYRFYDTPLADIPGPRIAAATGLWLQYKELTKQRTKWVHELHQRYGPVVRIGPDEVSFASWNAAKEIYVSNGSGYDKTSLYHLFDNYDTECMFSILEKDKHAEVKKQFADRYAKSFVIQPEITEGITQRAEEFVVKCTEKPDASANVYLLLHCYAMDCITQHLFDPHGLHSLTKEADRDVVKKLTYHDSIKSYYLRYYLPDLFKYASFILKLFPSSRRDERASGTVGSYILNTVRRPDVAEHSVISKLQSQKALADMPPKYIASECMDHAIAGLDTTGDGLCFLMYHLSLPANAHVQQKLHAELAQNPSAPLDDLPYLDGVVREGLRCFGPIPMSLPRHVPKGGRTIEGFRLPEGTIVSCQAHTLHRLDQEVWPEAEQFRPERWLQEGALEREHLFFAFSQGGRGCIGKHLALLEMKALLREVYLTYGTRVSPDMKGSMERDDQIISSRPKDQICLLTFEKLGG